MKLSELFLDGNVWRSIWRLRMWILGVGLHDCVKKAKLLYTILMPGHTTIAIECNVARNTVSLDGLPNPYDKWFLKKAV